MPISVFTIFLGSLLWGPRLSSIFKCEREAKKARGHMEDNIDKWESSVLCDDLERCVESMLDSPVWKRAMIGDVERVIKKITGMKSVSITYCRSNKNAAYVDRMLKFICMVRVGYLPREFVSYIPEFIQVCISEQISDEGKSRMCEWVEKSISTRAGIDAHIIQRNDMPNKYMWDIYLMQ